ncbi:hypothetical protein DYBT9275_03910 [Dyadobacter sp. CECT 9275]|uniref:Macroglobulin domain-containing protein n=1 Tax=Dyadobacter helix TaxID=2822344 RepID=A0A916JEB5_9BACT|nr:MG2 domain-containing protein [Dyadobacter sp. CECT 9275]CAG5006854.1 hypothetical protein DYBT9275_03910 [Dyadobacter sp. CECT 9275]
MRYISVYIFLILFANSFDSTAQSKQLEDNVFLEKLRFYSKNSPSNLLFVHTDKNIYTNNENIWFSAYVVRSESVDFSKHTILSLVLVREANQKVQLQDKFAMENGLASGNMALPDSLPPGNYQLIAYTDVVDKNQLPIILFVQKLTIKSITESPFSVSTMLLDTVDIDGKLRVKVQLELPDPKSRVKPVVEYSIGKATPVVAKIDGNNTSIITISTDEFSEQQPTMLISARYNDDIQYVTVPLPSKLSKGIVAKFYPEGGHLVDGLTATVGWETKTTQNLSVPIQGILFKDNTPIDTISTTSYGVGAFSFVPDRKCRYSVQVEQNKILPKDTVYYLPEILPDGIALHLKQAVVNDTLSFQIEGQVGKNLQVLIHDYREGYASFLVAMQKSRVDKTVVLAAVPKGLATITILDEEGRPVVERIFFAHYDRRIEMSSEELKKTYLKREKISTKLQFKDQSNQPVQGIVSIACVQENRFDPANEQDIESYIFLNSSLGTLPLDPAGRRFENKSFLEHILLIKGWRKYTWQDLLTSSPGDTAQTPSSLTVSGKVLYLGKPLKKAVDLNIMKDVKDVSVYSTNPGGIFEIPYPDLLVPSGKALRASVNMQNKDGYSIELEDPFWEVNKNLAKTILITTSGLTSAGQSSRESMLKGMEHATQLKEVIVRVGGRNNSIYGGKRGTNACGDYVIGNVLYYPHISPLYYSTKDDPNRRQPKKGELYQDGIAKLSMSGELIGYIGDNSEWEWKSRKVVYSGCMAEQDKTIFKLNGIYTAREFYGFDEQLKDFTDPQLLSTLYWKSGLVINDQGEVDCSFFTGDITGKFRIVVQGIGSNDLIYGQQEFEVK